MSETTDERMIHQRSADNATGHEVNNSFSQTGDAEYPNSSIERAGHSRASSGTCTSTGDMSRTSSHINQENNFTDETNNQSESSYRGQEENFNGSVTRTESGSMSDSLDSTSSDESASSSPRNEEVVEGLVSAESDDQNTDAATRQGYSCVRCVQQSCEFINNIIRILFLEIVPWGIGCFVIFYAFKNGGLGLGFSAFLLLVSAHGIFKWWTTRHPNDPSLEEILIVRGAENSRHRCHRHENDNDSNDESDFDDENDRVIRNEPPPSYDKATNPTVKDMSLDLKVHLTPKEQKRCVEKFEGVDKHRLMPHFIDSRRGSALSAVSYYSSEAEDVSLPSYSDAIKRSKRKKKRPSKRERRNTDTGYGDCSQPFDCAESHRNISLSTDFIITVPLFTGYNNDELSTGNHNADQLRHSLTNINDAIVNVGDDSADSNNSSYRSYR